METEQRKIWFLAIGISLLVTGIQFSAAFMTDSIAVWADAFEGLLNVITAVFGLVVARLALRPADSNHPYGHGRLEFVGMVIEGVLIAIIAWEVASAGIHRLSDVQEFVLTIPIALMYGSTIFMNGYGAWRLSRYSQKTGSGLARAESIHLRTDALTTIVILVSVGISRLQGWYWLDPILALLVAAQILYSGWELVSSGGSILMDEAATPKEQKELRTLIKSQIEPPLCGFHAVRTRRMGNVIGVNFHLVVDGALSVKEGHDQAHMVEDRIREEFPGAFVSIHIEPEAAHREAMEMDPDDPFHDPTDKTL